jgi:hypothetical protein
MKSWIKDWIDPNLNGPDRIDMTPAQRSVWNDLRRLAAVGLAEGTIKGKDGKAPSLRYIARVLNVSPGLVSRTMTICSKTGRTRVDEYGIHLITWEQEQVSGISQPGSTQRRVDNIDPDKYIKGKYGHMVKR